MTKPRLVKVRALFYVFQYITKQRGCANFDTASFKAVTVPLREPDLSTVRRRGRLRTSTTGRLGLGGSRQGIVAIDRVAAP